MAHPLNTTNTTITTPPSPTLIHILKTTFYTTIGALAASEICNAFTTIWTLVTLYYCTWYAVGAARGNYQGAVRTLLGSFVYVSATTIALEVGVLVIVAGVEGLVLLAAGMGGNSAGELLAEDG
jgi:hypothetical protein